MYCIVIAVCLSDCFASTVYSSPHPQHHSVALSDRPVKLYSVLIFAISYFEAREGLYYLTKMQNGGWLNGMSGIIFANKAAFFTVILHPSFPVEYNFSWRRVYWHFSWIATWKGKNENQHTKKYQESCWYCSTKRPQPNMCCMCSAVNLVSCFPSHLLYLLYVIHRFPSVLFKWFNFCSLPVSLTTFCPKYSHH